MKKEFDWDKFKRERIAVHCKTEEEAKDFCREMHEHGMKWRNGDFCLNTSLWKDCKEKTCYTSSVGYADYYYYYRNDFTILEWSDYMQKEFTKADLKDGMVVEYRMGSKRLVLDGKFLGLHGHRDLEDYTEDLKSRSCSDLDIMKVYQPKNVQIINDILQKDFLKLIWERKETKCMTAEEMRQKLEELTGEKIEVEPSKEEMVGVLTKHCSKYDDCNLCCIRKECEKNGKLDFWDYSTEMLKRCYEKAVEDGRK